MYCITVNYHVLVLCKVAYSVPEAAQSKAWVCGRSPAETVGSNLDGGMNVYVLCLLCVVQVEGLITRPEESYRLWCVVVCDLETS
jgi:hypothetical protein